MPATLAAPVTTDASKNWLRQPSPDRPAYECPNCGEQAMQFFRALPETSQIPERSNSFICCACGHCWQMSS